MTTLTAPMAATAPPTPLRGEPASPLDSGGGFADAFDGAFGALSGPVREVKSQSGAKEAGTGGAHGKGKRSPSPTSEAGDAPVLGALAPAPAQPELTGSAGFPKLSFGSAATVQAQGTPPAQGISLQPSAAPASTDPASSVPATQAKPMVLKPVAASVAAEIAANAQGSAPAPSGPASSVPATQAKPMAPKPVAASVAAEIAANAQGSAPAPSGPASSVPATQAKPMAPKPVAASMAAESAPQAQVATDGAAKPAASAQAAVKAAIRTSGEQEGGEKLRLNMLPDNASVRILKPERAEVASGAPSPGLEPRVSAPTGFSLAQNAQMIRTPKGADAPAPVTPGASTPAAGAPVAQKPNTPATPVNNRLIEGEAGRIRFPTEAKSPSALGQLAEASPKAGTGKALGVAPPGAAPTWTPASAVPQTEAPLPKGPVVRMPDTAGPSLATPLLGERLVPSAVGEPSLASLAGVESVAGATQATGFALEARGVALSSAVVESRLGPGLVKDLQQQFATLEEGEGRTVELRLDPPELGRITVRISLVGEEARVAFTAMQSGAREALEAALPRLREMFEEAGLTLGDAAVDSGSQREGRAQKPADRGSEAGLSLELEEEGAAVERAPTVNSLARGRLDLHV